MTQVQRWTGVVSANENGGFVAYGDYLALLDRVEKAEKDAARLDWLQEQSYKAPHLGWVARESTTGRGYRLHQDAEGAVLVRVAIDSAMEASK